MKKHLCLATAFAVGAALSGPLVFAQAPAPASAQAIAVHPNFTGTWSLDLAKSNYDQVPPPVNETLAFTQTDSHFTVTVTSDSDRGKENYTLPFSADGTDTPTPNDTFADTATLRILSSKGEWQGSSLIFTEKITYQGSAGTLKSTFTLSPDGKTLNRTMHISVDQGEFDTTSVYERQPASGTATSNPV